MQTNPRPFLLERYFGSHGTAKGRRSSDVESLSAARGARELSAGTRPPPRRLHLWHRTEPSCASLTATYGPNIDASHAARNAPEEGIEMRRRRRRGRQCGLFGRSGHRPRVRRGATNRSGTRSTTPLRSRRPAQIAACGGFGIIIGSSRTTPTGATLTVASRRGVASSAPARASPTLHVPLEHARLSARRRRAPLRVMPAPRSLEDDVAACERSCRRDAAQRDGASGAKGYTTIRWRWLGKCAGVVLRSARRIDASPEVRRGGPRRARPQSAAHADRSKIRAPYCDVPEGWRATGLRGEALGRGRAAVVRSWWQRRA